MWAETKQSNVSLFMNELDEKAKAIVSSLLIKRHARINELSDLINETDSITLIKIREVINPLAEKIFGKPILFFKESAIDLVEGKKVLFSWWIENAIELIKEQKKGLIDVFEEKNHFIIVMELPDGKDINAEINGNELMITSRNSNEEICRKVSLPSAVKKIKEKKYNNGILEIKLIKE